MATITNYGTLKTFVAGMSSRSDIADGDLDVYTQFAETRFNRTLRAQEMITTEPAFASTGRYTALPADFLQMERVVFIQSGRRLLPEYLTGEQAAAYEDNSGAEAKWYSIRGTDLEVIPASDVTVEMSYYAEITTITSGDTATNWLLTSYPDMYAYAVAMEMAIDLQDNARMKIYSDRYGLALSEFIKQQKRRRFGNAMRGRAL